MLTLYINEDKIIYRACFHTIYATNELDRTIYCVCIQKKLTDILSDYIDI